MATYIPSTNNEREYFRAASYTEAPNSSDNMMNYSSSDILAATSQQQNSYINSNISQQEILSNLGGINDFSSMHSVIHIAQNVQGQGLSLSLGSQCQNPNQGEGSGGLVSFGDDYLHYPESNGDAVKGYGVSDIARAIPKSKYLKAAQHLLDEVVNIRKTIKEHSSKKDLIKDPREMDESKNHSELRNKLTKLVCMLDEIDTRYRQYYHQMQIVVSSFDVIAGDGAAKPYTAVAFQTISRHFRCLRDAICDQIRASRKNLGEQLDASEFVDQHITQQQLWRPQRGLPETSVSILRAWLFQHFLHPYPKDSDKIKLARETGLTRSQVSNWFINARVRLWKPMVEEMYKQEVGHTEMDSITSSEREELQQNATSNHVADTEMEAPNNAETQTQSPDEPCLAMDNCQLFQEDSDRFSEFSTNLLPRGVSLTLGLQQGEGNNLPMSHIISADDIYGSAPTAMVSETSELNCLDSGNRRHPFWLLPSAT